jgi:hypothetical protein
MDSSKAPIKVDAPKVATSKEPSIADAVKSFGVARWGLTLFFLCLGVSSILSIFSITNAMSGHDKIVDDMNRYYIVFPLIVLLFCIAFSFALKGLEGTSRKIAMYMLVAVAFLFSMISLHLSTFRISVSL